ncbi:MAG TPA: hypothetical protein VIV06_06835 [Candidatus Limnocylindrales bacterium]
MSRQVATFATPYDADRALAGQRPSAVKVIAIIVAGEDGSTRIDYVVVDHDHRTAIVPAAELTFTDASVQPPRYG